MWAQFRFCVGSGGGGGVRVWQSTLFNTHKWLYVRRGKEVNSNHIKTLTFQPMVIMLYSNKRILKTSRLRIKCGRQRGRVTERKTEADWGWPQVSTGFGQTRGFRHTHERTKNPGSGHTLFLGLCTPCTEPSPACAFALLGRTLLCLLFFRFFWAWNFWLLPSL